MAQIKYIKKTIGELFDNKRGNSKYTKKYCNLHMGEYEVFTGTTIGSFGFINSYDYDQELLTYTTDGENAGTLKILKGKYSVGGHRAILLPKYENMNLEYFKKTLQKDFYNSVKRGDIPSINWERIKNNVVSVPVDENGNFDIIEQNEIVKKNNLIEEKKYELKRKIENINKVEVDFLGTDISKLKAISFERIFKIERGKVISKIYINTHKGEYPVYSTQLDEPFGYIDTYTYDGEYLIWNTDGLGGYIRHIKGKFSITNIVGIMKLDNTYKDKINLEYVLRILQPIFRENTKGREGMNGKNEYTKINSTMIKRLNINIDFPITSNGEIDIKKQEEIVGKYNVLKKVQQSLNEQLEKISNIEIEI